MGLDKVVKLALALTVAAVLTGQLPRVTNEIRKAQAKLLQESKAVSGDLLNQLRAKNQLK
ncbi:MAG: hypothetical protein ACXVCY_17510 [Pseudobdellovibrionaceae bacterium]